MKRKVSMILIVTLFMLSMSNTPLALGYSTAIHPHNVIIWEIEVVPTESFLMYYSEGGYWLAEDDSPFTFSISSVSDDVVGYLNLGNVSVLANDTEIAKDLTLGVWGTYTEWWPGLIIDVTSPAVMDLNETAYASAERATGNYLNGTMTSRFDNITIGEIEHQCIVFDYEQDPPGNQVTHLAYSLTTGVLIEANTTFTFGTPYELAFKFMNFAEAVDLSIDIGGIIIFTGAFGGGLAAIIVLAFVKLSRSK
ncbi:MAG: hypothetical protein ACFFCT_04240 [Candidatus Odinarchaeota archaeon]